MDNITCEYCANGWACDCGIANGDHIVFALENEINYLNEVIESMREKIDTLEVELADAVALLTFSMDGVQ